MPSHPRGKNSCIPGRARLISVREIGTCARPGLRGACACEACVGSAAQHPGAGGAHLGLFRVLLRRSGGMWLPGTRGAALYHKCARNGWPAWPFDASPCPHESARWPGGTAREIRVCPTSELGSTLVPDGDLGCSEHGMSMIWDLDTTPRPQTIATKSRVLQYLGLAMEQCPQRPSASQFTRTTLSRSRENDTSI